MRRSGGTILADAITGARLMALHNQQPRQRIDAVMVRV